MYYNITFDQKYKEPITTQFFRGQLNLKYIISLNSSTEDHGCIFGRGFRGFSITR